MPKFNQSVSCLVWAYNERPLIRDFLLRMNRFLQERVEDYEIVVVDDGSTDGTGEEINSLREEVPQILCLKNPKNLNVGLSFQRAVRAATKEYLFWQTVDWAYDLTPLRFYLELTRDYDVVAGYRPGGLRGRSDTLGKAVISFANYWLIRFLFGVPLSDYQNVCIYPAKFIQSFRFESKSSFSNPEGLIRAYGQGARIVEVPIRFMPRALGEPKGTKPKAVSAAVRDVLGLWFRWRIQGRFPFRQMGRVTRLAAEAVRSFTAEKLADARG